MYRVKSVRTICVRFFTWVMWVVGREGENVGMVGKKGNR